MFHGLASLFLDLVWVNCSAMCHHGAMQSLVQFLQVLFGEYWRVLRWVLPRLGMLIGSVVLALLMVEGAFRVVGSVQGIDYSLYYTHLTTSDRLPQGLIAPHDVLKVQLVPNTSVLAHTADFTTAYVTNSKGMRDVEHGYEREDDEAVVLAFGDSFTFGEGVPLGKRFTDVIEAQLDDTEVLNFGVPGYGSDQALIYYYLEGRKYEADTVILFTNLLDMRRARLALTETGKVNLDDYRNLSMDQEVDTLYLKPNDPLFTNSWAPLLNNWHSLSYIRYHYTLRQLTATMQADDEATWNKIVTDTKQRPDLNDPERIIQRATLLAQAFDELARAEGRRFLLVNIDIPQDIDFLRDVPSDIAVLDLSKPLEALSREQPLTFTYDQHYNAETHRFIGEQVAEYLKQSTF